MLIPRKKGHQKNMEKINDQWALKSWLCGGYSLFAKFVL